MEFAGGELSQGLSKIFLRSPSESHNNDIYDSSLGYANLSRFRILSLDLAIQEKNVRTLEEIEFVHLLRRARSSDTDR